MSNAKSVDLINAIRNGSSAEFKARIPEATQDNLADIGEAIMEYPLTRNEFVAGLVDRIAFVAIKKSLFSNPLTEFKKNTIEFGKSVEEVFVDIIKATAFDASKSEDELFRRNIPNVSAVFHTMNRKDMYKTTVEDAKLKQAFVNGDSGFTGLISAIIDVMYTSDSYDEFLLMKNLIKTNAIEGKFYNITVAPVVDEATAKSALVKIKQVSNDMTFLKTTFNHAGVHTSTPKADQMILIDTAFDALMDVEVLASAFNMDKVQFTGNRVLIDDFGGLTGVLCAIVDKDWFMVFDNLMRSESIYNPQGLYWNYFLHHWQTLSTSIYANAVLITTATPTVTTFALNLDTATVAKGKSVQLYATVTGNNNPSSKATWSIDGTDSFVTSTGLVIIGEKESQLEVTVTATSAIDGTKTDTCVITVS